MSPAILVHGGAGDLPEHEDHAEGLRIRREACLAAARAGHAVLADGGTALDAVQAAAISLEDCPLFNAGTGSVLAEDGSVETDAALMAGHGRRVGAAAAFTGVRNPIRLARAVLDEGRHVLMAGAGAEAFADSAGIERCDPRDLVVAARQRQWETRHGTIGAVAVDADGHCAAATSTGGISHKRRGRVGDTPLIGCGTWADERCAVSCTGTGEDIVRIAMARTASVWLECELSPQEACERAVAELERVTGGDAGLIMVGADGRIAYARNSRNMPVAWVVDGEEGADA